MRDTEITTRAFDLIATVARTSSTLRAHQSGGMAYGKSDVTYYTGDVAVNLILPPCDIKIVYLG